MNIFSELKSLLDKGTAMGLELRDPINKIERIIQTLNSDTIKIVLLGSFSDGKTSVVAGMLGKLFDNMKIDIDESSDELTFYKTDFLGKGFEIVDTPGLFGTKEKEIDGTNIRFSDTTRKYISEAHILLYVCDAVVPLKKTHAEVLRMVLKTFNKLNSTVFIINKMDATGIRLKNEEEFNNMAKTKKENLTGRLKDELSLTDEQCNNLNIVCVAADPKGKGLEHWFSQMDDYKLRSHIDSAVNMVKQVVSSSNQNELKVNANKAVAKDIAIQIVREIHQNVRPLYNIITDGKEKLTILEQDFQATKEELEKNRTRVKEEIIKLKNKTELQIDAANLSTIGSVISTEFGVEDNKATGYILISRIDSKIRECMEENNATIKMTAQKMENFVNQQNGFTREALTAGASWAAKQQLTGKAVLAFRDEFLKGIVKFKPWGAVKLAGNITKWAGRLSGILTAGFVAYDMWKKHDNEKKLNEVKNSLKSALNECISNVLKLLDNKDSYYENFAPNYIVLYNEYEEQKNINRENVENLNKFNNYSSEIKKWFESSGIEDVNFEESENDVTF